MYGNGVHLFLSNFHKCNFVGAWLCSLANRRKFQVDASFKFRKQMAPTTTVAHAMCVHAYTNICYIFFNLKILLNFFSNKLNRESCIY